VDYLQVQLTALPFDEMLNIVPADVVIGTFVACTTQQFCMPHSHETPSERHYNFVSHPNETNGLLSLTILLYNHILVASRRFSREKDT